MFELDQEISHWRDELARRSQEHLDRTSALEWLGCSLYKRFEQGGAVSDIEEAVSLRRTMLEMHPEGHPDRSWSLSNLAIALWTRFRQLGDRSDLDEAIDLHRGALRLRPEGHPDRFGSLNNLANVLCTRFEELGDRSDLDEAITLHRGALQLRPEGHPDRSMSLNNLAIALWTRFEQVGDRSDLDEAIAFHRSALQLELYPRGHAHQFMFMSLNNLATALQTRFEQLGDRSDLDEAIALLRGALRLRPEGHPDRSMSLNNLAIALCTRFEQLGDRSDLDEAITFHRGALQLRPEGHPRRSGSLNNLANALLSRFEQRGDMSDLDEAIAFHRGALELRPEGHPNQSTSLINLANALHTRFERLGDRSDLDEAITHHHTALQLCPQGHHLRSHSLNDLAKALEARFRKVGQVSDLDEAIAFYRSALGLRPLGHPDRSASLHGVASCLLQYPQDSVRTEEAFNIYSTLSAVSELVSSADLNAAQGWVQAAEQVGHSSILAAYHTSLRLHATHFAALPCLPRHLAVLKDRVSSLAMDAFAACIRHDALTEAVELLEQGRGVFWNQLTRLRSPVDEVIGSGGEGRQLGERFLSVSRSLRSTLDSISTSQHDRAWHLTNELRQILSDIRQLPGFSRFLLTPPFSTLQKAASGGPVVVVNASQYGCDALVVFQDRHPIHVPLQIDKASVRQWSVDLSDIAKRGKSQDVQTELGMLLRDLWNCVVFPIVQVLQEYCLRRSRVWWCPTAEFSLLPLHGAGEYRAKRPNFSDLYISSYTPTLTALIRSQRPLNWTGEKPRFVVVGYGEPSGESILEHVHAELVSIRESVGTRTAFKCIEGQDAQVSRFSEELQHSEFVHLACHGIPNPEEPFKSGFVFSDGLLTIQDIIRNDLQHSRLATLSACHSTVGYRDSPDEAIHLAASMQFVGYRSVVGTMWAVDDAEAEKIMTAFYRNLVGESGQLDHTRSALALHKTLRTVDLPLYQRILFVHIGA